MFDERTMLGHISESHYYMHQILLHEYYLEIKKKPLVENITSHGVVYR